VVLTFHGGGGNPESMIRLSGLNAKADEAGCISANDLMWEFFQRHPLQPATPPAPRDLHGLPDVDRYRLWRARDVAVKRQDARAIEKLVETA
jgi:hypothetical protein